MNLVTKIDQNCLQWIFSVLIHRQTEAPEEEYDSRTLFERLKEQRDRKQEDFEESRKLKHLIRGLDNEEVSFLEQVDANKLKEEEQKHKEEEDAIREYQSRISNLNEEEQTKKIDAFKKSLFSSFNSASSSSTVTSSNRSSTRNKQANLLVNAIKIRKDNSKEDNSSRKDDKSSHSGKRKREEDDDGDRQGNNQERNAHEANEEDEEEQPKSEILTPAYKTLGILPGLASYCSDSSDSDNAESDEDEEVGSCELDPYFSSLKGRQILKKIKKENKAKKACS